MLAVELETQAKEKTNRNKRQQVDKIEQTKENKQRKEAKTKTKKRSTEKDMSKPLSKPLSATMINPSNPDDKPEASSSACEHALAAKWC